MIAEHPLNRQGRDFFVGDVHGMFGALRRLLIRADFDVTADRVFSVGDLIDRGPESAAYSDWLDQPWFFAVRGNHEALALRAARAVLERDPRAGLSIADWEANGGAWMTRNPAQAPLTELKAALDALPWLREVDTPLGRVGVVHAQVPAGLDWPALCRALPDSTAVQESALWSRERIERQDERPIAGIGWVVSGHTPLRAPLQLGNQWFIDTGACYVAAPAAGLSALVPTASGWRLFHEPTRQAR